jgi:hypothetical protein
MWSQFCCQRRKSQSFSRGFLHLILFFFNSFLGRNKKYVVPYGTVVAGILDMRPGKHDLHFLVGVELLPHAFVNISDEKMHIGVLLFIFIIYSLFILVHFKFHIYVYIYIFLVFCPLESNCNCY